MPYSLQQVLKVGRTHPYYNSENQYPASPKVVQSLLSQAGGSKEDEDDAIDELNSYALLWKRQLNEASRRLLNDLSPLNTFRDNAYTSVTGGGSGSMPLTFITDAQENRKQRAEFGQFLRTTGIIDDGDWLLTLHFSGDFYRSLDLISEIMECAGASVLSAGNHMGLPDVASALQDYHVNVLSGESSHIVALVHFLSTLPDDQKARLRLNKIVYTSEVLTRNQRALIRSSLGDIAIYSVLGSAEAGPWAVHNPKLTGSNEDSSIQEFVYDIKSMKIEIFEQIPIEQTGGKPQPLPDGTSGLVVQTSLARIRHPLIRYNTGDIGSLHQLPEAAHQYIREGDWQDLRVLRLQGRSHRYDFKWEAITFEHAKIKAFIEQKSFGVLHWQLIFDEVPETKATTLELRLARLPSEPSALTQEELVSRIKAFFMVYHGNEERFKVNFYNDASIFERSVTGRKIINFVDRVSKDGLAMSNSTSDSINSIIATTS